MGVGGFNFTGRWRGGGDYHFHRWAVVWGWATWRRAWQHFNRGLDGLDYEGVKSRLRDHLSDPEQIEHRGQSFDFYAHQMDTPWN